MRIAAIDLGTNSFLCLIAEVRNGSLVKVLDDSIKIVRLGEAVHKTKRFQPAALIRAEAAFTFFSTQIKKFSCERVVAVATSAARDVENGAELIKLGKRFGIPIQIISGDTEARLTYQGMTFEMQAKEGQAKEGVVGLDIGGGSTEFIVQNSGQTKAVSIDVGCVRLTEMFVTQNPILSGELMKLREYARESISRNLDPVIANNVSELIAVAGTPTALACLDQGISYSKEGVHAFRLYRKNVQTWIDRLAALSIQERLIHPGLDPGRADVIVAGAILLDESCGALNRESCLVSTYGARYGLALTEGRL